MHFYTDVIEIYRKEYTLRMKKPSILGLPRFEYKGNILDCESFNVETRQTCEECEGGWRYTVELISKNVEGTPLKEFDAVELEFDLVESSTQLAFMNGYQSWTDSREYSKKDRMKRPNKMLGSIQVKHALNRYSDYEFFPYTNKKGHVHGCSWGHLRFPDAKNISFFSSLNERTGFTFFRIIVPKKKFYARKELQGFEFSGTATIFDLWFAKGDEDSLYESWFKILKIPKPKSKPTTGWTSWYNYYQNISESCILGNLESQVQAGIPAGIFQIDDGYQTAIGDWFSIKDSFPHGMKYIADKIHAAGWKPGIWLAPFAAEKDSVLFKEHQDWFICGDDGKPYKCGGNWSGFYSLDLELDAVKKYIRNVFKVVLEDWGFEIVKLDFLYGVCILPRNGKTRGKLMCEAMDFLRDCVGEKEILACGVPLWPAFGKVDYCRIGTDVDLAWENWPYNALIHREYPSTRKTLKNTVWRRPLDGRAFLNDPDVFLLRHTNISLTPHEKETVFQINRVFGSLLFTSDDLQEYSPEELQLYRTLFPFERSEIQNVSWKGSILSVTYTKGSDRYQMWTNFSWKTKQVPLKDSLGKKIRLKAHETRCEFL